jgi:hypothetical protein
VIKIETAHIEEVRGIRKLDIDFGQATYAISGPNGSGKSGVIDAIEFPPRAGSAILRYLRPGWRRTANVAAMPFNNLPSIRIPLPPPAYSRSCVLNADHGRVFLAVLWLDADTLDVAGLRHTLNHYEMVGR